MSQHRDPQAREDALHAIALIRASLTGDFAGQQALLNNVNPTAVLGATAGLAITLGIEAHGSVEKFLEHLATMQTRIVSEPK